MALLKEQQELIGACNNGKESITFSAPEAWRKTVCQSIYGHNAENRYFARLDGTLCFNGLNGMRSVEKAREAGFEIF